MKKTLISLALAAGIAAAQANPTISFVQLWSDNSVTVHVEAGSSAMEPGIVGQTYVGDVLTCETYFDCPIAPNEWGNLLMGDVWHGCAQACNTTYKYRVRGSSGMAWSNWLTVHTGTCNSF